MNPINSSDEAVLGKAYDARLMARLWRYVRPHLRLFTFSMLLIPLAVVFELAQPFLLKIAIDVHIADHNTSGLAQIAFLYVGAVFLQALVGYAQLYTLQLVGQRSMHELRQATYKHLLGRRLAFFDRVPIGRLLTRMTNDIENINEMFASGVVTLIADLFKLLAIIGIMLYMDVKLTLMTFVTIPFLILLVNWARGVMRGSFREIRVKIAAMNAHLQEHLSGIGILQLFAQEKNSAQTYNQLNADHRNAYLGAIKADATMYAVVEAIGFGSVAAIAWYSGTRIGDGILTVGLVVAFVEYIGKFFIPIRDLSAKYTVMQSAMAAAERITTLLDNQEDDAPVQRANKQSNASDPQDAVSFENVHFSYRADEKIIHDLSLTIRRGETVAIVGATGSGKSTIIKLITRFYEPDQGVIRFGGTPIQEMSARDLRQRITIVNQDVYLFSGTIADNVRLGKLNASDEEVQQALIAVGADRALERRDRNLNSEVSERGQNFSSGERQLISFARAIVRNPEFLILDEATAHIDPEAESVIEAGLSALTQGRTSLIIAHRLSTIQRADRIIVLSKGRVAESGTRAELLAAQGLYSKLEATFERSDK